MLTPFGIAIRKLRLDKRLRLLDLADKLDMSSAFVSAVETGKKAIPHDYVRAVAKAMKLNGDEAKELQNAADRTRLTKLTDNDRELVAAFARQVDQFDDEFLAEIKNRLKSISGEVPFKRNRKGILVTPYSNKGLWELANRVRASFVKADQIEFPIIEALEFKLADFIDGFYLDVCDQSEMGRDEGRVIAGKNCIMLRKDVYEAACRGEGRARFTACHELAHFIMHREVVMARTRTEEEPVYRDAEWQADSFAGSLLMSSQHLQRFEDADDAAAQCGMTPMAAQVMWSKYKKEGLM